MAKTFNPGFDRYAFSALPDRPVYDWPGGRRLAVYIALNVEAFEFGKNPGKDFTSSPAPPYHRGYAYRDFGNRVGVWRLLSLFKQFDMPLGVLANASVLAECPAVLHACAAAGHEMVGHGRSNSERQIEMSEDQERDMLASVAQTFETEFGKRPEGWLGPFISQSPSTPELLVEQGFTYMLDWYFDEQPAWFRTDNGPILAVPYPSMDLNDLPAYVNRGMSDAEFTTMAIDAFDEQLRGSSKYPLVYCLSLHTFLSGQPQRIVQLRKILEHIAARRDSIWLTTPGAIAAHVRSLPEGTLPGVPGAAS